MGETDEYDLKVNIGTKFSVYVTMYLKRILNEASYMLYVFRLVQMLHAVKSLKIFLNNKKQLSRF